MIDSVREILETIARHRLRALATCFGVFWGIFMLTLLLAGGTGLRNGIDRMFAREGRNAVWIATRRTTRAFEGLGAGRPITLQIDDAIAIERTMHELLYVSPRQRLPSSTPIAHGTRTAAVPVFGVDPDHFEVQRAERSRGRFLNQLDLQRARKVVMIGKSTTSLLFEKSDPIGRTISIGGIDFTVVGEFSDPSGDSETLRVYIPFSTLVSAFDPSGRIEVITASLRPGAESESVRRQVIRLLARRHRFDPTDEGAAFLWFADEEQNKVRQVLRGIDLAILVVGLGTLLSGMVGVSNILFVAVRERTKEFALRRALGATGRSVLGMVMAEAVLLALVSGALGLLSAMGLVQLAQRVRSDYFQDPSVNLQTALSSLTLLVVAALVAGYFPAREAARMHPIEALRRE